MAVTGNKLIFLLIGLILTVSTVESNPTENNQGQARPESGPQPPPGQEKEKLAAPGHQKCPRSLEPQTCFSYVDPCDAELFPNRCPEDKICCVNHQNCKYYCQKKVKYDGYIFHDN